MPLPNRGELRKEIANEKTSKERHVRLFPLSALFPPSPVCCCGNYSQCATTKLNRPSFCFYNQKAQYTRVLSLNRKTDPAPFVIPPVHWKRLQRGGKEKINAVKCGDRKMSFWQMQGFVYAQIEFWWISPQARSPCLIDRPSYKNVKQWCNRKQIQMSLAQNVPQWTCGSLWKILSFKDRQPFKDFLKAHKAIFRKMLHKTCILIWSVMGYLHGEINANEFALVQKEVWAYCQAFDACNGFLSNLQAAAETWQISLSGWSKCYILSHSGDCTRRIFNIHLHSFTWCATLLCVKVLSA